MLSAQKKGLTKKFGITMYDAEHEIEVVIDVDVEFETKILYENERNQMYDLLYNSQSKPFNELTRSEQTEILKKICQLGVVNIKGIEEYHSVEDLDVLKEVRLPGATDNVLRWLGLKIWSDNVPSFQAIKN